MKFVETSYLDPIKSVIKFPDHYVGIPVMLDDAGITANSDGKKIISAGTIIGGAGSTNTILGNTATLAVKDNTQAGATGAGHSGVDAEGVLFTDVDVTYGSAPGTMIIHGFIDLNKLPEAPCADAIAALKSRIVFLK